MPLAGPATRVAVNVLPSTSESLVRTFPVRTVSSSVVKLSATVTGASLTGLMVIDTVAVSLVAEPSVAVYVKESAPLKSATGV
ncbi:hypothetical protein MYFR107205_15700 [Mycolicibacterium frederiksbergense]